MWLKKSDNLTWSCQLWLGRLPRPEIPLFGCLWKGLQAMKCLTVSLLVERFSMSLLVCYLLGLHSTCSIHLHHKINIACLRATSSLKNKNFRHTTNHSALIHFGRQKVMVES